MKDKTAGRLAMIVGVVSTIFTLFACHSDIDQKPIAQDKKHVKTVSMSREESLNMAFSSWNGSHRDMVSQVKRRLKNPRSFEHVGTRYTDQGDDIMITMRYRAENSFGATITSTAIARASVSTGKVTQIYSLN